jgi:hypothetical protein
MGPIERDGGWRMPNWLWQKVEPLLPPAPPHPLGCHRPHPHKPSVPSGLLSSTAAALGDCRSWAVAE